MRISVKVKPASRQENIEKIGPPKGEAGEEQYQISVKEPPAQGRANKAVIKLLAEYFQVSPSRVSIVSGHTSRTKIVEIR